MRIDPQPRQAAALVTVLLLAATGCGTPDKDDAPPAPPAAFSDEQLLKLCADESVSYPGSPAYSGSGPHPIRFYVESATSDEFDVPQFPFAGLNLKWSPSPGSAQLAGCARRTASGPAFLSCGPYTAPPTVESPINIFKRVPAYRVSYEVRVYEVSTRRLVDTVTVTSRRKYGCPERIVPFSNGGVAVEGGAQPYVERNGAPQLDVDVTEPELEAAFAALVTGPSR